MSFQMAESVLYLKKRRSIQVFRRFFILNLQFFLEYQKEIANPIEKAGKVCYII